MAVIPGNTPDTFEVNGRSYRVEYARLVLARKLIKNINSIIIPDTAQKANAPTKGVVIAAGETADKYWQEAIGKEIYFARFAGDWIKLDREDQEDDQIYICQDEDALITRIE